MEKLFSKSFYTQEEASSLFYSLCYDGTVEEVKNFLDLESVASVLLQSEFGAVESNINYLLECEKYKIIDEILKSKTFQKDPKYWYNQILIGTIQSQNLQGLQYFLENPEYKKFKKLVHGQSVIIAALNEHSYDKEVLGYLVHTQGIEKNDFFQNFYKKIAYKASHGAEISDILSAKKIKEEQALIHKTITTGTKPNVFNNLNTGSKIRKI